MSRRKKVETQEVQKPPIRDVNATTRVNLALQLRARKTRYEDIAAQCGYGSAGAAHKAIQRELERITVRNVNELRQEEALTLDMLQEVCYKHMEDKEHEKAKMFAVDRILAIQERRAKLMGLDTPVDSNASSNLIVIREVPIGLLPVETVEQAS